MLIARILTLICSLVLLLPPGWCCTLGAGPCCPIQAASGHADAQNSFRNKPVSSQAGKCCCCTPTEAGLSPESTPEKERSRRPAAPIRAECCELTSTPVPVGKPIVFHAWAASIDSIPMHDCDISAVLHRQPAQIDPLASPLHVLHCVWLC